MTMAVQDPTPRAARETTSIRNPRRTFLIVALLFVVPPILAWLAYATIDWWRPQPTASHGDLVIPARPLEDFTLERLDGSALRLDDLRGHWTMIYVAGSQCDQACQQTLYITRQVWLALNKDMPRVERLLVLGEKQHAQAMQPLLQEQPGLIVAWGSPAQVSALTAQLAAPQATPAAGHLFLVDPLGNFMMSYPPGFAGEGLLKDLERLLRLSRIG